MKRRHLMPFGAQTSAGGTVEFRLWAPSAPRVEVELSCARTHAMLAMRARGGGWYSASVENVEAGARYAFRIDGGITVPDPASRWNPHDVHEASAVVDPCAFEWPDASWRGRSWEEAVIYELHIGTFTPAGTFAAAIEQLDYLVRLGVTAIEIMPVSDFPGARNWGYDGVLPFAPDSSYGTPDDLKRLVAAAHERGLMTILDVVYNHFGPEGNYLHAYAPQFFSQKHQTPWGVAINFDGEHARTVRDFFIHNALYWLEEFHFDGLRIDAVHAIADDSEPDIVTELAAAMRRGPGRERHVHLILENDRNEARYLARAHERAAPLYANAQWNDDFHHALHVLATGERDGYYADYAARPLWFLGRVLAEGFGFQGEPSPYRGDRLRGEKSQQLPATAFVNFMQSHDQVGNRPCGDRIAAIAELSALRLGVACLLLAPSVPMLFMGEEFAASAPFQFFCDFGPELAHAVRDGRRAEFSSFTRFQGPAAAAAIPDPNAESTFLRSKLDWRECAEPGHREWHALYSELLELRRRMIVPHLSGAFHGGSFEIAGTTGLAVDWILGDGSRLALRANFSSTPWRAPPPARGEVIYALAAGPHYQDSAVLPAWGSIWMLESARG
jgi:malto-oligosyltrehalose trehalohydrolase